MAGEQEDTITHKSHRDRNAGRKAEKKKAKNPHTQELSDKQRNPKAFTFNSTVKAERRFRRNQDIETKRQHIPLVDRTPLEPPPVLVAVVGPPKVGKSLLIQCLIKCYTKYPLNNIVGPVTVVSGKKQRITFIECNNDINSMIDIAKIADIVLLLIDASFGFEMEVFEFLNICQVHGMPRIMGVLTHLDNIKNITLMKKTKKALKQRFWKEVYPGAKLFNLSGILYTEYLRHEVKNLSRFISVTRCRPLIWRTTHPYLLADRMEDLTNSEDIRKNPKIDRNICLYGYVRGVPLKKNSMVHIPGCGDLQIKDMCFLPDPCPLPEQLKKRALVEKERLVYAPFSGVGGIVYDKDAVYIDLGGSHSYKDDTGLMEVLRNPEEEVDKKLENEEIQLFAHGSKLVSKDVDFSITRSKNVSEEEADSSGSEVEEEDKNDEDLDLDGQEKCSESGSKRKSASKISSRKRMKTIDEDENENDEDLEDESSEGQESESDDSDGQEERSLSGSKRKSILKISSLKRKTSEDGSSDESSDEDSQEHEPQLKVEIKRNKKGHSQEVSSARKPDTHYKDKIAEALSQLSQSSKSKNENASNEEESFDELSGDELENISLDESDRESAYNDEDSNRKGDENEEEDDALRWKNNLAQKAREAFLNRRRENINIDKIVYSVFDANRFNEEEKTEKADESEEIGGIFHAVKQQQQRKIKDRELKNQEDHLFFSTDSTLDWLLFENKALIVNRFVTGKWKESEDAEELLKLNDLDEEAVYGDFEDLETGEKFEAKSADGEQAPKEPDSNEKSKMKKLLEKKLKLKKQFEAEYDDNDKTFYDDLKREAEHQSQLNKSEFRHLSDEEKVQLEGYRPGMYVRVEFDSVPYELVEHLDPSYPLIIGGLLPGEQNVGYVQVRVKKHRWYPKILKSRNPLIISVGWRRFQTVAIFSKLEDNLRHRMLKYTPEHVACIGHFWGPITPQNSGVLAVQDVATRVPGFRIIATGTVVETSKTTTVVKKLKLTGAPLKIYKKTAFIKDMFNSALEVAKFEGVRIKTVSGIRGQIKKALSKPEGCFRATFEDKIQLSDIVFCRTWYKIDIPKFYNPVTSLLLPPSEKNQWRGMKTTGQLKREQNIQAQPNVDSLYVPIEREVKVFKPLFVPKNLQKELPYRDKPKLPTLPGKRKQRVEEKRVAVVREPKEEMMDKLMNMIKTTYNYRKEKQKEATHKRITAYKERVDAEEAKKFKRQKELKKQVFRTLSKMEAKKNKRGN